jgi:hypothetical protein
MVTGADGCAYGIPHNASQVLKVDPAKAAVALARAEKVEGADVKTKLKSILSGKECGVNAMHDKLGEGRSHFGSAALADDGFLYAAPTRARCVTRIDSLCATDPKKRHSWHCWHIMGIHDESGWQCDGKDAPGGCQGSGGGSGTRYRCQEGCEYDLCKSCWEFGQTSIQEGSMHWLWRNNPEKWFLALCNPLYRSDFLEWFQLHAGDERNGESLPSQCGAGLRVVSAGGDADVEGEADQEDGGAVSSRVMISEPARALSAADGRVLARGTRLVFKKASTYG